MATVPVTRYEVGKFYWWKCAGDMRVLTRLVSETPQYLSCRVVSITPEQVLRCLYGAGEMVHLDKRSAPLERA